MNTDHFIEPSIARDPVAMNPVETELPLWEDIQSVSLLDQPAPLSGLVKEGTSPLSSLIGFPMDSKVEPVLRKKASDLALIKTALDPMMTASDAYNTSLKEMRATASPTQLLESYQQRYGEQQAAVISEVFVEEAATGQRDLQETQDLLFATQEVQAQYQGPAGKERILVDEFAAPNFSQYLADSMVANNYAWEKLQDYTDQKGYWDWTKSIAGLLAPDAIKDANDLVGSSVWGTRAALMQEVRDYRATPPTEQPAAFDELWERAVEAYDGNHIKLAGFIDLLTSDNPEGHFDLDASFDIADIATVGYSALAKAFRIGSKVKKHTQMVKKLNEMGAQEEAAALNVVAGRESAETMSEAVAGDKLDIALTRSPLSTENMVIGYSSTDGLAPRIAKIKDQELQSLVDTIKQDVAVPMERIQKSNYLVDLEKLNSLEKTKAVGEHAAMRAQRAQEEGLAYEEVGPVYSNEKGFVFAYKIAGQEHREAVKWSLNDVGVAESLNTDFARRPLVNNLLSSWIVTPEAKLSAIAKGLVDDLTFAGAQAARAKRDLTKIARSLDKGMSKGERAAVDNLLIAGDEEGRIFSAFELKNGLVELRSGTRAYSPREIENYFKKVQFNQELWRINNNTLKKQLEFRGAKAIKYKGTDGLDKEMIGMPKNDFRGINVDREDFFLAPQQSDSGWLSAHNLDTQKLLDEGFRPVELLDPIRVKGREVKYAILKEDPDLGYSFSDLPERVLHWNPGYAARVYKDGMYFVKDINSGSTLRAFMHKKNADAWSEQEAARYALMTPEEKDALGLTEDINPQVFRDRELNSYESLVEHANMYGGLFTGARKKEPLLLGEDGLRPERLSWAESTQKYINSVAEVMPINEYKLATLKRYNDLVAELAKNERKPWGRDPNAPWTTGKHLLNDATTNRTLDDLRDHLRDSFALHSKGEKQYYSFLMGIAEWASSYSPKLERGVIAMAYAPDPIKAWATATYNAHLGFFNPRQLYVQSQNAILAISAHPIDGAFAASKALPMQALMRVPDNMLEAAAKKMEDPSEGYTATDLVTSVRAFRRAGMEASITRNADIQAINEGLTSGTFGLLRDLSRKGLFFYEQGELFGRLTAWNIAQRGWRRANPDAVLDDSALRAISKETFRLHINMQRENASQWQKGIVRVPTQFQQAMYKFQEKLIPSLLFGRAGNEARWTRGEASRILAGQFVFYGLFGQPIAEEALNYYSQLTGKTVEEISRDHPEALNVIQHGMLDSMFKAAGFDNQFGGDAAALWTGLDDNVITGIVDAIQTTISNTEGDAELGEILLGPGLNTARKTGDAVIDSVRNIALVWSHPSAETGKAAAMRSVDSWLAITSTWSNARKARWLMQHGETYSKSGDVVLGKADTADMNMRTKIAQAWGFQTDVEVAYWATLKDNQERALEISNAKKTMKHAFRQFYLDNNEDALMGTKFLLLGADGDYSMFSPMEKAEILDGTFKDIYLSPKSRLDKELQREMNMHIRSGGRHPMGLYKADIYKSRGTDLEGIQ